MADGSTSCGCAGSDTAVDAPEAAIPNWAEPPTRWDAIEPTGGAGSSGSSKVQVVEILGDSSRPGHYTQLLKVAPHAKITAHHHAGDRTACVLKGTWMFGYGERFDEEQLKVLPVGSIYTEPSRHAHFAATGEEEVVVAVTGMGPTDTVYVDPSQDPTKNWPPPVTQGWPLPRREM